MTEVKNNTIICYESDLDEDYVVPSTPPRKHQFPANQEEIDYFNMSPFPSPVVEKIEIGNITIKGSNTSNVHFESQGSKKISGVMHLTFSPFLIIAQFAMEYYIEKVVEYEKRVIEHIDKYTHVTISFEANGRWFPVFTVEDFYLECIRFMNNMVLSKIQKDELLSCNMICILIDIFVTRLSQSKLPDK